MTLVFALLLTVQVWAQGSEATDSSEQRARELFENGAILYDEGRYEDAIIAWQEAYSLSDRPLLLYNIASAQERLGLWQEALDTLNRYRVYAAPDERDRLERRIVNLERRLASESAQGGVVDSEPADPRFTITGGWMAPTSLAVGAAGMGAGVVFALRAQSAREDASGLCVTSSGQLLCPGTAADALQQDRVSARAADISFLVGGVGLLGGTALVFLTDAPVLVSPSGILLHGRF